MPIFNIAGSPAKIIQNTIVKRINKQKIAIAFKKFFIAVQRSTNQKNKNTEQNANKKCNKIKYIFYTLTSKKNKLKHKNNSEFRIKKEEKIAACIFCFFKIKKIEDIPPKSDNKTINFVKKLKTNFLEFEINPEFKITSK